MTITEANMNTPYPETIRLWSSLIYSIYIAFDELKNTLVSFWTRFPKSP